MIGGIRDRIGGRRRSARGTAELSVVVVTGSLLAGVLFGNGVTRTAVEIADGVTWFTDDPTGEVIQVNPATGRPEARIPVGDDGDELDIAQYDGRLIVTNRTTGELTSFDLTSILASGQQRISRGGATDVLQHDGRVFLLDRDRGTIADIDPVTTDPIGELWSSPEGIADAAIDDAGHVWAIDPNGLLTELRWSPSSARFVVEDTRDIDHSGPGSVLVGHDRGVTVFGPDEGIVVQVGTGHDVVADAIRLAGDLVAPAYSPDGLVPVASPETGTVAIVGEGQVREVEVTQIGCEEPGRPEVFEGLVYVPCSGAGRVVRLTPEGQRTGTDIEVTEQDGDPDLVLDDGNLLINVPGADKGAVVHPDGTVTSIVRYDSSVQPSAAGHQPFAPPPVVPQPVTLDPATLTAPLIGHPPANPAPPPGDPDPTGAPTGTPGRGPDRDPDPEPPAVNPNVPQPLEAPRSVMARELPSGMIQVTWQHAGDPADTFTVQVEEGPTLVEVSGSARQASVTVSPGTHRFTVTAIREGDPYEVSAPSNPVSSSGRPSMVTGIVGHVSGSPDNTAATITVRWNAAEDNGSPILHYTVVLTDATGTQTRQVAGATTTTFTSTCTQAYCDPSPVSVKITATNAKGEGPAASAPLPYDGPEAPALPAAGRQLVTAASHSWWGRSWMGHGTTKLTLAPPPDWRSFSGTCSWTHVGNSAGEQGGEFPCDATGISVEIQIGVIRGADSGVRNHSIVFTANNGGASVNSATYTWQTKQEVVCTRCA